MTLARSALLTVLLVAPPASATDMEFGKDLAGSLRGCETWVLDPSSWTNGPEPFLAAIGRGERVASVAAVPDAALPPPGLRRGNLFWKIAEDKRSGIVLTVSESIPMCHIVGGGALDLRETVGAFLASADFDTRWEKTAESRENGILTAQYRFREEARFTMTVSHPDGSRADPLGIQVLATAIYEPGT